MTEFEWLSSRRLAEWIMDEPVYSTWRENALLVEVVYFATRINPLGPFALVKSVGIEQPVSALNPSQIVRSVSISDEIQITRGGQAIHWDTRDELDIE